MTAQRSQRAARALAHLPEADPGLAGLAIWCDLADAETAATYISADTIYIGTGFGRLPLHEQIGVLGHHILHIALRHELRLSAMKQRFSGNYDEVTHNLCADAIVNSCLIRAGHALPRPAVLLEDLICKVLPDDLQSHQDPLVLWDMDRLYTCLSQSGKDTEKRQEDYCTATGFQPDIRPEMADPDRQAQEPEWRTRLIQAQQAGGSAGRGIGPVLRHLAGAGLSRTPWERHLRRLLARATTPDPRRSYRRPRSSWIARDACAIASSRPQPAFEPAQPRQSRRMRIVVGVDTSGSIGNVTLGLFAGEIAGIANRTGAEIHILCFDETVYAHHRVETAMIGPFLSGLAFRREGGTSFIDVIAEAEALAPSAIVLLSDANGTFGPTPAAKVIWAHYGTEEPSPPFGECVNILR